jgi:hypothetical protein
LVDAETAERLRKPESGTEVRVDSSLQQGARSRIPLEGAETQWKVGSDT